MGRLNDLEVLAEVLRHRKVSIQPPTVMLADQFQQGGEATQFQFGKHLSRMVSPFTGGTVQQNGSQSKFSIESKDQ